MYFQRYGRGQTDKHTERQTDTVIAIFRLRYQGGEVIVPWLMHKKHGIPEPRVFPVLTATTPSNRRCRQRSRNRTNVVHVRRWRRPAFKPHWWRRWQLPSTFKSKFTHHLGCMNSRAMQLVYVPTPSETT